MVTIASSFVLVTLKEGREQAPGYPQDMEDWWSSVKGKEWTDFFGTVSTYIDSDGLKWEHRFERPPDEDELIGFGSNGEEVLIITLESFYPTTAPGISGAMISPSAPRPANSYGWLLPSI